MKTQTEVGSKWLWSDRQGFHGDKYLRAVIHSILEHADQFVETGTNVGYSLYEVAANHRHVSCYSCEVDPAFYQKAKQRLSNYPKVQLMKGASPEVLAAAEIDTSLRTVFWLDAHDSFQRGFRWPLRDEIAWITATFEDFLIFVDDFKVPDDATFGYDEYGDQQCSLDFVKKSLANDTSYSVFYPKYWESEFGCNRRGWGLILPCAGDSCMAPHLAYVRRAPVISP